MTYNNTVIRVLMTYNNSHSRFYELQQFTIKEAHTIYWP